MSKFKLLNENIYKVMTELVNNQNLCKLLFYNSSNALSMPDIEDTTELLYKNIYPYTIAIEPEEDPKSFISVALDDFYRSSGNYLIANNKLVFNVLCHNFLWRIDEGLRPFMIMSELDSIFNNEQSIGIGNLLFDRANCIYAKCYTGYRVSYEVCNYNGR